MTSLATETERLYRADPYLRTFDANVARRTVVGKRPAIVLDRTAFYATSGGQPNDTGTLNGVAVVDVIEDEADGSVLHVLAAPCDGEHVHGEIDWARRFDHMQQHSGQHILSQAFEHVLNAPTVSFHLGADVCTIDVQLDALPSAAAAAVEDLANSVVFANRIVRVHEVTRAELARFPLRKQPVVDGLIRIVEMDSFDYSPCGGTHVRSAGEIGLIKIRRWEKRGDTQRVDFFCGQRALLDYRWKNDAVMDLAASLSIKDRELAATIERHLARERDTARALEEARRRLLEFEARAMLGEAAPDERGRRVIARLLDERGAEEARRLAMALTETPATIVLFGLRGAGRASLIFARAADLPDDMNALLKQVAPVIGGRGGGTPSLAQGGGAALERLEEALAAAQRSLAA